MAKTRHIKTINGHKWAYLKWGHGRPIFVLHGMITSAECNTELAKRLQDKFTVIAPDLPGFGFTPAFYPSNYHAITKDLIDFIQSFGYQQVDLLGYSLGGTLVLDICINKPKLVYTAFAISPFWKKEYIRFNFIEKIEFALTSNPALASKLKKPAILRLLIKIGTLLKPDLKKLVPKNENLFMEMLRQADIASARELLASIQKDDLTIGLNPPFPRTLFINGTDDQIILKEYTRELAGLLDQPLLLINKEDHEIIMDAPQKLARIVTDYVFAGKITTDPDFELFQGS